MLKIKKNDQEVVSLAREGAAEAAASCRACWPSELPDAQAVVSLDEQCLFKQKKCSD